MSALPAFIDVERPLPAEIRQWISENSGPLMRALVNELGLKESRLRDAERERDELRRRLRDTRGLPDA